MKIWLYIPDYEKFIDHDEENDYCRYAEECTTDCHQCRYFEQKCDAESEVD